METKLKGTTYTHPLLFLAVFDNGTIMVVFCVEDYQGILFLYKAKLSVFSLLILWLPKYFNFESFSSSSSRNAGYVIKW